MIAWDHIPDMLKSTGSNCFRLVQGSTQGGKNRALKKLHEFQSEGDVAEAVDEFETIRGWYEGTPGIKMQAGKHDVISNNWAQGNTWPLEGPTKENDNMMGFPNMRGMNNPMAMMMAMNNMGMVNQEVMTAKLETQRQEFDYMTRLAEIEGRLLEKEKSIVPAKYDKWVDLFIARQAGIKPDELIALHQMYGTEGAAAPAALSGTDVQVETEAPATPAATKGYTDPQWEEIQKIIEGFEEKAPYEDFIALLKAVRNDPSLLMKAKMFLKL